MRLGCWRALTRLCRETSQQELSSADGGGEPVPCQVVSFAGVRRAVDQI